MTASITQSDRYDVDWDDIDSSHRPAMEAARLMHTARQMADTSWWWLMRWPRWPWNASSLLVRAGNLNDDEACKLFRALRVKAVKFGLELASQPAARRDAKEASDVRTRGRRCASGGLALLRNLPRGTARRAERRCWTGSRSPTYRRKKFGDFCTIGPSKSRRR